MHREFYDEKITKRRTPAVLFTDNGTEFMNNTIRELTEKFGTRLNPTPNFFFLGGGALI